MLLSGVILTYCIRWFIFAKAGEKGWKALIPFYSDYITYKIAWDGRIYLATLIASIASTVLGSVFGLIHPALGMFFSIVLSTVATAAKAIADLILNFKLARAFGKSDYFFVGLYFLNNVFTAILAFGECEYKGPPKDQIGVPKFIDKFGKKNNNFVDYRDVMPQPMQRRYSPSSRCSLSSSTPSISSPITAMASSSIPSRIRATIISKSKAVHPSGCTAFCESSADHEESGVCQKREIRKE